MIVLAFAPVGMCQTNPVEEAEPESSDIPDEIVVYGRKNIVNLRQAVYAAEDSFFAVFNSLNGDDEYDVVCEYVFRIQAHRKLRECKPEFVMQYKRDIAQDWITNLAAIRRKEGILVE